KTSRVARSCAGEPCHILDRRLADKPRDVSKTEVSKPVDPPVSGPPNRSRLGEILLADGRINKSQLEHALEQQVAQKRPLGQILTKLHYVTDEVMREALGRQLNIPYVDLDNMLIDRELARVINRGYAKRHMLVPVAQRGSLLTVVMDDPTAQSVIDDLGR